MTSGGQINFDYLLKYIIIGDAAVGKSNLLLRYQKVHSNYLYHILSKKIII